MLLQLAGHVFEAGRRHDFNPGGRFSDLDFDFLIVELALPELFPENLPGGRLGIVFRRRFITARLWQKYVQNTFFGQIFSQVLDFLHLRFANHLDRNIGQVPDNRLHVASDIADFGELGRFNFDEGGVGQSGQSSRDLGFTDAGRADHQDIFWRYLVAQIVVQLHAAPAVA